MKAYYKDKMLYRNKLNQDERKENKAYLQGLLSYFERAANFLHKNKKHDFKEIFKINKITHNSLDMICNNANNYALVLRTFLLFLPEK